jgi:catalase
LFIGAGEEAAKELMNAENKHKVLHFINEAYQHCKAIYFGEGTEAIYKTAMSQEKA